MPLFYSSIGYFVSIISYSIDDFTIDYDIDNSINYFDYFLFIFYYFDYVGFIYSMEYLLITHDIILSTSIHQQLMDLNESYIGIIIT